MDKKYQKLEKELKEAYDVINAIRHGDVDTILTSDGKNTLLRVEKLEMVEERNHLLLELDKVNDQLLNENQKRKSKEIALKPIFTTILG